MIKIGAQVYIEPGQKKTAIDHWFGLLKKYQMTVCRIRMDESHMRQGDQFDFALYDMAFEAARNHGIQIFATLFPDNIVDDVGGFKFPETEAHQKSIARYIAATVNHFKTHPALSTWVLQNEPGMGGTIPPGPFTENAFRKWKNAKHEEPTYNAFIKMQFDRENFLRDYTTWYLNWIATEVKKYDNEHQFHVNNHMIFSNLPEYDFAAWRPFLSHLGASMHPSWHFGYFDRPEYPLAISANCEIIRSGAGHLPFWVTELQGGNNNFSSYNPLTPTSHEIAQWMWTSITSGARGIIFWTLNPRAVGFEAGEWSMIDFQGNPTDRLEMAGKVASLLVKEPDMNKALPLLADIHILYSPESMHLQKRWEIRSEWVNTYFPARMRGGHIKSVLAHYKSLLEQGVAAQIQSIHDFSWGTERTEGQTVILANMAVLPRVFYNKLKTFVHNGGQLIVTGQTAHFDEFGYNVMFDDFPLKDLFGGQISEFQIAGDSFSIMVNDKSLPAHYLKGIIKSDGNDATSSGPGQVVSIRHAYGKGKVTWVPSMIGLAAWQRSNQALSGFLIGETLGSLNQLPFVLNSQKPNVTIRHMIKDDTIYTLCINKYSTVQKIDMMKNCLVHGELLFLDGVGHLEKDALILSPETTMIIKWSSPQK